MITLQERTYRKNGVEYLQYRINISQKIVDSLNWKGNDSLELVISDGKIIIQNKTKK